MFWRWPEHIWNCRDCAEVYLFGRPARRVALACRHFIFPSLVSSSSITFHGISVSFSKSYFPLFSTSVCVQYSHTKSSQVVRRFLLHISASVLSPIFSFNRTVRLNDLLINLSLNIPACEVFNQAISNPFSKHLSRCPLAGNELVGELIMFYCFL